MTMDQQDYFDDDDMINDYIEEDFDEPPPPPPFSDEDMLDEEEELQAVKNNSQTKPESSSTLPTMAATEGSPVGKDADVDMEDVEDEIGGPPHPPATSIRLDFAAKTRRKPKEDIYSFERYVR